VSRLLALNVVLLTCVVLAIVGVEVWDRPEAAVEASVRRYATAVTNADFDAAMAEIAPSQRARWSDWVRTQLGNVYDVTGIAVRAPWLLAPPGEVTTDLDVNRGYPDEFYQASPRESILYEDGRWYLRAPLLAPTSELDANGRAVESEVGAQDVVQIAHVTEVH
jgi:hypothetical protein